MMGLAILIFGLALFLASHTFTTFREARQDVIRNVGEGPYKAIYSAVALIGLLVAGYGLALYRASGWIDVWSPPLWTRHLTVALIWPA